MYKLIEVKKRCHVRLIRKCFYYLTLLFGSVYILYLFPLIILQSILSKMDITSTIKVKFDLSNQASFGAILPHL